MSSDVRWLLAWFFLTMGLSVSTGLLVAHGQLLAAAGIGALAVLAFTRWNHWNTAVSERHRAEREGDR